MHDGDDIFTLSIEKVAKFSGSLNSSGELSQLVVRYDSGFLGAPDFNANSGRLYLLSGAGNFYAFMLRKPPRKTQTVGRTLPYVFNSEIQRQK